jgi:hypothetical protein
VDRYAAAAVTRMTRRWQVKRIDLLQRATTRVGI